VKLKNAVGQNMINEVEKRSQDKRYVIAIENKSG
jgi:hypothetical protein